jgi:hypothetical protein
MSTTRRDFLQRAALGALALPLGGMSAASEMAGIRPAGSRGCAGQPEFDRIFFDARRAQALAFGETARQLGGRIQATSGDIDDSCYDDLQRRWRIARTPVAGMTDFRVLFLLQTMASDAGLRPVLRIHHCGQGASVVHQAFGSNVNRAISRAHLSHAGPHWGRAAARLVACLAADDRDEICRAADMNTANLRVLDSRALVTWAIA